MMGNRWKLPMLAAVFVLACGDVEAQQDSSAESLMLSVEEEVRRRLLSERVGPWTVRELNLPEDFVGRIVDRAIQRSYRDRFHLVVRDDPNVKAVGEDDRPANIDATYEEIKKNKPVHWPVTVHLLDEASDEGNRLRRYGEGMPSNRAFTYWSELSSLQASREQMVDITNMSPKHISACDLVARRLARDGILWTTLQVIRELGSEWPKGESAREKLLAQLGVPVDLFRHFEPKSSRKHRKISAITEIANVAGDGGLTVDSLAERFDFRWIPADEKFAVMSESGEHVISMARLQLTRSLYWAGKGSGDGLDVARQVVGALPDAKFLLAVQRRHGPGVLALLREWQLDAGRSFELVETSQPVSQWAQDNGKGGTVAGKTLATIVPRYATRLEVGANFVPIESAVMEQWGRQGHRVVRSSLLFQGGNVLCVQHPKSKSRILLVGEAEIHRNVALGLSAEQVRAGFARDFAVDNVVVLPANSYHVDFDVSVRAHEGKLIAFVNDPVLASRWIVAICVSVLERAGVLNEAQVAKAKNAIAEGDDRNIVATIGGAVRQKLTPNGGYPLTLAKQFSTSSTDSGVGNLQRLLTAIDILAASVISSEGGGGDRLTRAYIASIQRQLVDMGKLHDQLRQAGFEVVSIPSLSAGTRSVHYLNGVHTKDAYLMPVYGGLFEPLDKVVTEGFRKALGGGVRFFPILTSESQRRDGAVHCSVCVYPKINAP